MMRKSFVILITWMLLAVMIFPVTEVQAKESKKAYKAYYRWIKKKAPSGYEQFKLIKLDKNKTPELLAEKVEQYDTMDYRQYILCTYKKGKVKTYKFESVINYSGSSYIESVSYIPKTGKVLAGTMWRNKPERTDDIYGLKNGTLKKKYSGKCENDGKCVWDGKTVSRTAYEKNVEQVYNTSKAKNFSVLKYVAKKKMLKTLKKKW